MAATFGHVDKQRFLIHMMHRDPIYRNANEATALHLAAQRGHLDIVQFFLSDWNCDLGQYTETALHCAAEFGHLHIVKYLTDEQGCNPSCLDEKKLTPLHYAAMKGHIDVVKFLKVEKHSNPMHRDF